MALPKQTVEERLQCIIKAFFLLNGKSTAKQVFEFINRNNFGLGNITYYQVVNYLRTNVHNKRKNSRNCLRHCYGYDEKPGKPREYYIKE